MFKLVISISAEKENFSIEFYGNKVSAASIILIISAAILHTEMNHFIKE